MLFFLLAIDSNFIWKEKSIRFYFVIELNESFVTNSEKCFQLFLDSQQKHNSKSKHSAPNHNVASQSNKGSKAAPQPDNSANMVANVKQTAPAAVKEQQPQQTQPHHQPPQQQPTSESKPVVPVAIQPTEPTKIVESTNSGRNSEKTKQQQPPQPVEKVHSEDSVTKR